MKCTNCKVDYPYSILSTLNTSEGNYGIICGICALEISNTITEHKRSKFQGKQAEYFRQQAIKHRTKIGYKKNDN